MSVFLVEPANVFLRPGVLRRGYEREESSSGNRSQEKPREDGENRKIGLDFGFGFGWSIHQFFLCVYGQWVRRREVSTRTTDEKMGEASGLKIGR